MAKSLKPHTRGSLCVYLSGLDPDAFTKRLGVAPSRVWRKGQASEGHRTPAKTTGWSLDSSAPRGSFFRTHVESVLRRLRPVARRFKLLRRHVRRCYVGLTLGCHEDIPMAWQTVPAPLLGELHELAIDLEFTGIGSVQPVVVRQRRRAKQSGRKLPKLKRKTTKR